MAVVSSMILRSMRLIGEKARGATLDSNESTECLGEFNTFLDSLGTERLYAFALETQSHGLTASTSSYTIGIGGDINIARPVRIVDPVYVRNSDGNDSLVRIIDANTYGRLSDKAANGMTPQYLYYDAGFSSTSTARLHIYPPPTETYQLYFSIWRTVGSVSTVSQNLALPPGYQLFLESNFALHLAAGQVEPSAALVKMAKEAKTAIKGLNAPPPPLMNTDLLPTTGRGDDIVTGGPNWVSDWVQ
jgi:hypothetical protein